MAGNFQFGAVLLWREFDFPDGGEKRDKFFIVLGARKSSPSIAVICTSQQRSKKAVAGCHAEHGYYFIPGGGKDFFRADTWVELHRAFVFDAAKLVASMMSGEMSAIANLRPELAAAVRNCFKRSEDASAAQIALLE